MPSTSGGQQKVHQLSERPSANDIAGFLKQAVSESGTKLDYAWRSPEGQHYTLGVKHVSPTGKTCEWRFFSGPEGHSQELWFLLSDNTLHIYDCMLDAIGGIDLEKQSSKDGVETFVTLPTYKKSSVKSPVLRERMNPAELAQTFDSIRFDSDQVLKPQEETLKGNLTLVHITNLLQSIGMGQMSGRLRIKRHTIWSEIYFENGLPVHAVGTRGLGEDCFLQTVCWVEGDFEFEPKLRTDERTIVRSLETLVLEGVLLHDNTTYLTSAGVRLTTVLARTRPNMNEAEFDQAIQSGSTVDPKKLKTFYLAVDGSKALEDVIAELKLLRSQWVPVVADLMRCNLIMLSASKKVKQDKATLNRPLNFQLAENAKQALLETRTNIYSYSAFMLFLSELIRCSHDHPVSIMLLEVQPAGYSDKKELSASQVQELVWRIDEACNFKGIISHYDQYDFAVILPGVVADKTARRADRLLKSLVSTGLQSEVGVMNISVAIGIACHPDDAGDLGALLAEAERALEKSRKLGSGVSMARPPSM